MSADTPIFRFAPSPNGELHLGHAYSALLNAKMARRRDGRLLLRIEDIDTTRCTPQFEEGIYRDLEWLGVEWDTPVRRQSRHFDDYADALQRLTRDGLVYPAFMSRGEIRGWIAERDGADWPRDPDGAPHYPPLEKALSPKERARRIESGAPYAWRLDMQQALDAAGAGLAWHELTAGDDAAGVAPVNETKAVAASPSRWGDVVLARKETPTSYHLSVVVDDALQGVTHVVRGLDLYEATSVHRLLQRLLGLPAPTYHHHRLILDPDGRKLSKSARDTGLRQLREAGMTPGDIRRLVGFEALDA